MKNNQIKISTWLCLTALLLLGSGCQAVSFTGLALSDNLQQAVVNDLFSDAAPIPQINRAPSSRVQQHRQQTAQPRGQVSRRQNIRVPATTFPYDSIDAGLVDSMGSARLLQDRIVTARQLERGQRLDESIQSLTAIGREFGEVPIVLHRLAVMYDLLGHASTSRHFFRRALAANPHDPELLCDYGFSCFANGMIQDAEHAYRQALYYSPKMARAHNNLAVLLAQSNRPEIALTHFQKAGCNLQQARINLNSAVNSIGTGHSNSPHLVP